MMSKKSATVWSYNGFELFGSADAPYYIIAFTETPTISTEPIILATGNTLYVGDTVAFLGSKKTSAGFSNLHPVAPGTFKYVGTFKDDKSIFVLWETGIKDEKYKSIYYGHSLFINDEGVVTALLYTNRAGSGRVIESEIFHATHETIPQELYPKPYQKEMGWVA
jgi:hypothetical protein